MSEYLTLINKSFFYFSIFFKDPVTHGSNGSGETKMNISTDSNDLNKSLSSQTKKLNMTERLLLLCRLGQGILRIHSFFIFFKIIIKYIYIFIKIY